MGISGMTEESAREEVTGDSCKPNGSPVLGRPGGSGCR
ncbi:hypothetical protein SynBIOSE41_02155 [Synechococcus sp. BIOS-E4-1]|nr:hypothetical protein SynBIOSE41_02155 [Synechococcus sp. BIOS-E4-1]